MVSNGIERPHLDVKGPHGSERDPSM